MTPAGTLASLTLQVARLEVESLTPAYAKMSCGQNASRLVRVWPSFLDELYRWWRQPGVNFPYMGENMASTRRRKLKKLRMKKANHGKRPLAGK